MKLFDLRNDCVWYGGDCGDGSKCDTECFEATPFENHLILKGGKMKKFIDPKVKNIVTQRLTRFILILSILILLFFAYGIARAADVTLAWDANTETTLAGYNIFQAERIGDHSTAWEKVGTVAKDVTEFTIADVDATKNYAWQVTAFDNAGNESRVSNMVELVDRTPPMPPPNLRKVTLQ